MAERGDRVQVATLRAMVWAESIEASMVDGGSWEDGVFAAVLAAQIRSGFLGTHETKPGDFTKTTENGEPVGKNKNDGSVWQRERSGDRGHGGSSWKRWANKRDFKNDRKEQGAKRMTLRAKGTVRDHGKRKTSSGTKKKRGK